MFWNQVEKEKIVENERAGERKREGGSGIKWRVEKKRRGWKNMGICVQWTKNKRKKKKTYG